MTDNQLKISIVIPVYNERLYLESCLKAVAKLSIKPFEVIVVDNNSSDGSLELARSYSFVRVVQQPRQGVVHARNLGFDQAKGDIIARIDADTIVNPSWLQEVITIFQEDPDLSATSGSATYYDLHIANKFARMVDLRIRGYLCRKLEQRVFLFGSNMAIRKADWEVVKTKVCSLGGRHEDLDLAIHLQENNFKVNYSPELTVNVSMRRIKTSFRGFIRYSLVSPRTYRAHGLKCQRYMYLPILIVCSLYAPGYIVYSSYDPKLNSFSFKHLINNFGRNNRVDPTVNVK